MVNQSEHQKTSAKTYSLPETVVMVVALRALRFCYGSSLLRRESLLYKDRWEVRRGHKVIVKEGLGMRDSMERCGLGWFLPKFNWSTWRLAPPHGENVLVGNMLMHEEYKRRWRAVKDLRDVFIRFNQAETWYGQYSINGNWRLQDLWLEYLHVLNLEQFDTDIWKTMLKSHRRCPELRPEAIQKRMDGQFCYQDMKEMFQVDGQASPPHVVTGNSMRLERVIDVLEFLFMWDDGKERCGWGSRPYWVIFQKSFELIKRWLGYSKAKSWLDEFFYLVRLTHWVLPYPSNKSLIASTKTSRRKGLRGRMMWFSAVYADPQRVQLPLRSGPSTLSKILRRARMQVPEERRNQGGWGTSELMTAYKCRGVECDYMAKHWVAGRNSVGVKGFIPLWELGHPGRLKMLEQIRDKSLEELEGLMARFSQEQSGQETEGDIRHIEEEEIGESGRRGLESRGESVKSVSSVMTVMSRFAERGRDKGVEIHESRRSELESRVESDGRVRRSTSVMSWFAKRGGEKGPELGESRGCGLESRGKGDRSVSRGAGVMARFAARSDDKSAWVGADRRVSSTLSVSSGSVFVPSISDRS
ncbi:hypothetical protein V502_00587 [Pseudogymnoascus sp. VKM F-4520 (FW-2644)]|nr:hypothetical protein V502_00587 [Pseudogymnoascus sp. VKM F-4520 (FW-2644)]